MSTQRGIIQIGVLFLLLLIAGAAAGAAFVYRENRVAPTTNTTSESANSPGVSTSPTTIVNSAGSIAGHLNSSAATSTNAVESRNSNITANEQVSPPSNANANTNFSDGTAGWETYTNSIYKYSFKHPSSWILTEYVYSVADPLSGDSVMVNDTAGKDGRFTVCPDDSGNDCSPFQDGEWNSTARPVTVSGKAGIEISYTIKNSSQCSTCTNRSTITLTQRPSEWKGGRDFRFEVGTSASMDTLNTIRSTFTFLDK